MFLVPPSFRAGSLAVSIAVFFLRRTVAVLKADRLVSVEPFKTGWLDKHQQASWGRPVDVLNLPDGSMLVSDDAADAIYRITYRQGAMMFAVYIRD